MWSLKLPELYSLAVVVLLGYLIYYTTTVVKRPFLVTSNGPFRRYLRKHVPMTRCRYWPCWWCIEGRAQTLLARIVRSWMTPAVCYRRELLTLSDGGQVALDWLDQGRTQESPVVVILPGLLGDSQSEYVKHLARSTVSMGAKAVVFNYRGLAGVQLRTPRLYCACSVNDLSEVLNHVRSLNPKAKIATVGVSMGGLIVGNYLVHRTEESKEALTAAFTISLPWNMFKGSESIDRPIMNRLLGRHLTRSLCRLVSKHEVLWDEKHTWNMKNVMASRSIRDFDANFTCKNFGFKDLEHYYSHATLHDKLDRVQVPLVCLNAADDPFQPMDAVPVVAASKSSHVAIFVTVRGGHIGFLEGAWPFSREPFMCWLFRQFLTEVLYDVYGDFSSTTQLMLKHHQMLNLRK
ncbi:hypothetical protein RP20_CCG021755 [Aedes albopictus]|nr:hypothetical protein RP20_CCG021755 [Aedes albopictus]